MLVAHEPDINLSHVITCENFSSLQQLLRVTAYVVRFVKVLKCKIKTLEELPNQELTATDIVKAEVLWMKEAQGVLTEDKEFDVWKKQLDLFLNEDGLYRCRGRLFNADIPFSSPSYYTNTTTLQL